MSSTQVLPGREAWLERRRRGIGASEAGTILGLNDYKSRYALWAEKVGLVEPDDLSGNEAVEWGGILEEPIAQKYAKATKRQIFNPGRFAVRQSDSYPWMFATLDREILPVDGRGRGILEIKTTGATHADEWEEDAPEMYKAQIQHQMVVTGYRWGSLAVLIGGQKFRWMDVEYDAEFAERLIASEREFWRLVETETPPETDASESTRKTIHRLYPRDTGETIALPPEAGDWADQRAGIKAGIQRLQTDLVRIENRIKSALGNATTGLLPDGSGFRWQLVKKAAYTVPESEYRVLREVRAK